MPASSTAGSSTSGLSTATLSRVTENFPTLIRPPLYDTAIVTPHEHAHPLNYPAQDILVKQDHLPPFPMCAQRALKEVDDPGHRRYKNSLDEPVEKSVSQARLVSIEATREGLRHFQVSVDNMLSRAATYPAPICHVYRKFSFEQRRTRLCFIKFWYLVSKYFGSRPSRCKHRGAHKSCFSACRSGTACIVADGAGFGWPETFDPSCPNFGRIDVPRMLIQDYDIAAIPVGREVEREFYRELDSLFDNPRKEGRAMDIFVLCFMMLHMIGLIIVDRKRVEHVHKELYKGEDYTSNPAMDAFVRSLQEGSKEIVRAWKKYAAKYLGTTWLETLQALDERTSLMSPPDDVRLSPGPTDYLEKGDCYFMATTSRLVRKMSGKSSAPIER